MTFSEFDLFSIVRGLEDPVEAGDSGAVDSAVEVLAAAMAADSSKVPVLVKFLATGVWSARKAVAEALVRVPDISRPVLLESLDPENPELSSWCLKVISKTGTPADMARVESVLSWPDSSVQAAALSCLASIGKSAAAPRLANFLTGTSWRISKAAFEGLMSSWAEPGQDLSEPVSMAEGFLASRDKDLHYWGVRILSGLPSCSQTLDPLRKYAAGSDSLMGFFAISAIARNGSADDLGLIISSLESKGGWFTARTLIPRLAGFHDPRILDIVLGAFAEDDEAVAPKALEVAVTMMESAGPILAQRLKDENPAMIKWCCLALGQARYQGALPSMIEIVETCRKNGSFKNILPWVIEAVGLMDSPDLKAIEVLVWAGSSDDWYLRTRAVESMARLYRSSEKNPDGKAVLRKALASAASDRCWTVRNAAHGAEISSGPFPS